MSSVSINGYRLSQAAAGASSLRPASTVGAPPLRLTKRGRAVLMTLAATPLVIAALVFALNGGGAHASLDGSSAAFTYVTVSNGETLWQVAEHVAPNADPRDVIDQIVQLNQLPSADVYAGEQLAIPSQYLQH